MLRSINTLSLLSIYSFVCVVVVEARDTTPGYITKINAPTFSLCVCPSPLVSIQFLAPNMTKRPTVSMIRWRQPKPELPPHVVHINRFEAIINHNSRCLRCQIPRIMIETVRFPVINSACHMINYPSPAIHRQVQIIRTNADDEISIFRIDVLDTTRTGPISIGTGNSF